MNFKTYDYSIADHWLSALINGDYSGLDDDDITALENFMSDLPSAWGHWAIPDDYPYFRIDDVSGHFANCVSATYMVPVRDRTAELEAKSPFKLTTNELYEWCVLVGYKPAGGES